MLTIETLLHKAEADMKLLGLWEHWNLRAQHITSNEAKLNYAHAVLKEKMPEYDPTVDLRYVMGLLAGDQTSPSLLIVESPAL